MRGAGIGGVRTRQPPPAYAAALARELEAAIQGEVRFDSASRALYATDGSNYRQVPIGVVLPRSVDDVVATLAACRRHGAPVLSRGGGTSLAGQCCNVAVIMDFSKYMHDIVALDAPGHSAWVQPGCVLDRLRAAAQRHALTFAPDPSTHTHNTLGGMIGNNSCGVHSIMGGKTSDNIQALDILTYDGLRLRVGATGDAELEAIIGQGGRRGEIYGALKDLRDRYAALIRQRYPRIPRRVSGYNLDELLPENGFNVARALVGSEGTCATVLQARVRLVDSPPVRSLLVLGYADVFAAADHVMDVLAYGPIGLEGMDDGLIRDMTAIGLHPEDISLPPPGGGWLLVEFGGQTRDEAHGKAHALMSALGRRDGAPSMKLFDDPAEERMIWTVRESGLGATAHVPGKHITWEGWEDAAVPPERLGAYLRDFRKLLQQYAYHGDLYGHFGHGCVHTRIDFDLETRAGIDTFHRFLGEAADLVVRYGGSLSGEHGDGQAKAQFLSRMFGPELVQAFAEFKAIWDPQGKMNPGKIVHPHLPTDDLRIGVDYDPPPLETHFQFAEDRHDFGRTVLRCVGVGNCRRESGGTMCPSYQATREEKHSTRGRSRMLFEMLRGELITDGWRSAEVRDALDLCLGCKGCKGECPVGVDMAAYKAEFLAHHYRGRLRPRAAYAMGLIDVWARLAAHAPGLANRVLHASPSAAALKALGGIAAQREMPAFAPQTFAAWFARRPAGDPGRPRVILWPDTFTNHFLADTGKAAVEVLEDAGYRVTLPGRALVHARCHHAAVLGLDAEIAVSVSTYVRYPHAPRGAFTAMRCPRHRATGARAHAPRSSSRHRHMTCCSPVMTREKVDKMALIVAARFNTFDAAEAAASQLMAAGVTADDLFTFFVNPADKPGPHPAEDPASGGAWIGAAVTGLVGAVIGALIGSVFGLTAIGIVGGAGVGAYVGSLAGALRTLGRQRPPRSPVGGAAPPAANAGRPSGVLLAVHVQAQDEQRIAHLLRDAGGQEVERAQGRWEDGKWQDFDPLGSPDMKRDL